MNACATQVLISETCCDVIEVSTPGPQGPTGPMGNLGPTGPGVGATGPTGPPGPGGFFFSNQITATLANGTTDSYSPAGYIGGTTNALILTPDPGGSTLAGLSASGVPNGFTMLIWNASPTIPILFLNQSSATSANDFACPGAGTAQLMPQAKVFAVYLEDQWVL